MTTTIATAEAMLLEQPNRRRIVEHLERVPGDHFRSIVRSLQLSRGTVRYHLLLLERNGFVRSEKIGGRSRYFVVSPGHVPAMNDVYKQFWTHSDLRVRVWSTVLRLSDARPSTVAAALGLSRQLAAYHLKKLAQEGRVVRTGGSYVPLDSRVADRSQRVPEGYHHLNDAFRLGGAVRRLGTGIPSRPHVAPSPVGRAAALGGGMSSPPAPGTSFFAGPVPG